MAVALAVSAAFSATAFAAAGTAQPPIPGGGDLPALSTLPPPVPPPIFSAPLDEIHAFTATGFLQGATVSGDNCPELPPRQWGGTAKINGLEIVIPCNSVVQFPAATFTWAEIYDDTVVSSAVTPPEGLVLGPPSSTPSARAFKFPSVELTVVGNIVARRYIAGLVFVSQQFLNTGAGYITGIDYANGVIFVGPTADSAPQTRLLLNDINGRFSAGQSADSRFNVDDENPTVHAATGYPMCIPRVDPSTGADDPLCPQRNRPRVNSAFGCRNFAAAGIILPSGQELAPPSPGQVYCSGFVMGDPATVQPTEPTSRQQAPFEIGDHVTFQGTLLQGDGKGPLGSDTIAVHTLEANVGIYTAPGTLPVYLTIGEFTIGTEAPRIFNNTPQEVANRLVLEASVTDVTSTVDIYLVDVDPRTGASSQRWVTPESMTGFIGTFYGSSGQFIDGGIVTQYTGPVPGRVRIHAGKATPGILESPTRFLRVIARSLCDPLNVNDLMPEAGGTQLVPCVQRAPAANGLSTGQYMAPVLEYLFPENIVTGDLVVPNNFWTLGFLVNGEGSGTGPLIPSPW